MSVFKYVNNTNTDIIGSINTVKAWDFIQSVTRLPDLEQYINSGLELYLDGVEQNNFVERTSDGKIATAMGRAVPITARPIRNISVIGDSVVELTQYFGLSFSQPSNIQTNNITSVPRGSLTCPDGSGTLSLTYQNNVPYLQWTAPTDTPGPLVPVKDGIFTLPSGTADFSLTIPITAKWLSTTPKTDILTSTPSQRYWRRPMGAFQYIADTLTFGRFNWLRPLGIGANNSIDIGNRYDQVLAQNPDLIIDRSGGNDVVSGSMTIAASVAARVANWKLAVQAGIPVIVLLMSARTSGVITTQKNSIIVAANAAYKAAAMKISGVYVVDCYTPTVDSATGYAKTSYTTDGIHWGGGAAYEAGVKIANILNILAPDDRSYRNIGLGSYYDSVNNTGGNLLLSNQGAFAGVGGTPGSGATVGTGIAAGINVSTSSPVTVICNKVAATDGGPDWQELVISGATADAQFVKVFFGSGTYPTAGSLATMSVEFEIIGNGCNGIYLDCPLTISGPAVIWDAHQMDSVVQGIRPCSGVISYEPITWPANVTNATHRIFVLSKASASFTVRLRNADFRMLT